MDRMFNPEMETLPREELEKLQLQRLRKTLLYLKNFQSFFKGKAQGY
jgi:phenylacetate-CoA ligase